MFEAVLTWVWSAAPPFGLVVAGLWMVTHARRHRDRVAARFGDRFDPVSQAIHRSAKRGNATGMRIAGVVFLLAGTAIAAGYLTDAIAPPPPPF